MIKATIIRPNYGDNKKNIRDFLLSSSPFSRIVGLGGLRLREYMLSCRRSGFKHIEIYEHDKRVAYRQLALLATSRIRPNNYFLTDIINADVKPNTLYDLDFCARIDSVKEHIKKFRDNFILTVSELYVDKFSSISKFFEYRNESIISDKAINNNQRIVTSKTGQYLFTVYKDSSQMLIINKI